MVEPKTPEQIAAEQADKAIRDAGYAPGMTSDGGDVIPLDQELVEEPPVDTPAKPTEPEKPKWTDEEVAGWKERASWSEREKQRADQERAARQDLEEENKRLRGLAGQPERPAKKPERKFETPEQEKQWNQGQQWLRDNLPELLPELIPLIPAEVLGNHPAMRARDVAILRTREEVQQTRFLSNFGPEDRETVATTVLPELMAERQAGGFKEGYEKLWADKKKSVRESARLLGLTLKDEKAETLTPPKPPKETAISIPPSLSGVRSAGGPLSPEERTTPMSAEELRLYGFM